METLMKVYTAVKRWAVSFGKTFAAYSDSLARAKAAAELTRAGYHKEAKALLLKD
jgi:hypothetical protein